jgi:hypothetical protein
MLLPATRYIKAHSPGSIQQGLVTSGAAKRAGPGGWRPWEEINGAVLVLSDAFLPHTHHAQTTGRSIHT